MCVIFAGMERALILLMAAVLLFVTPGVKAQLTQVNNTEVGPVSALLSEDVNPRCEDRAHLSPGAFLMTGCQS